MYSCYQSINLCHIQQNILPNQQSLIVSNLYIVTILYDLKFMTKIYNLQSYYQQIMEVPNRLEDALSIKTKLFEVIRQRYGQSSGQNKFNFQFGEQELIQNMENNQILLKETQKILTIFAQQKIQNAYCYYRLKSIVENISMSVAQKILQIQEQLKLLHSKESNFHKINHLIVMRQVILSKLQSIYELTNEANDYIEDHRFITEEIIKFIRNWKNKLKQKGVTQHIIFVFKNNNYITKMINDNQNIVNHLNSKHPYVERVPNPFFIQTNTNITGISIQSVNSALQILSEQKALELKMMIESPLVKSTKSSQLENELKLLRNKMEEEKIDQIKTIYRSTLEPSKDFKQYNSLASINKGKLQMMTAKNQKSFKNLQKLIKMKEIQMLKQIKKSKIYNKSPVKNEVKEETGKERIPTAYLSKIQNLRTQVEKNIKKKTEQSPIKIERLPKVEADIKNSMPKIKILLQREVPPQNTPKAIIEMMLHKSQKSSRLNRSQSTFFKQQPSKEAVSIKKKRDNMISSTYSSKSPFNRKRRTLSTGLNLALRNNEASKNKSKNLSRQQEIKEVNQSLALLNSRIREQTIKNIYQSRVISNRIPSQINKPSIIKQNPKAENDGTEQTLLKSYSTYEEKLKQKTSHIQQLKLKLKQLRSAKIKQDPLKLDKIDEKVVEESEVVEKDQLLRKQKLKTEKQKLEIENKRIKQELKAEELKFMGLKQKQFQLKEQQMQNKYKSQLLKIKEELSIKNKQFEQRIVEEKLKNQQKQQKIKDIITKSEQIRRELEEKEIKEQLLTQILQEEHQKKEKQRKEKEQRDKSMNLMENIKKQQEKYKLQLQQKTVQKYQQEKLQLNTLFLEMQRKNQELQNTNKIKQLQLQGLEDKKLQQQKLAQELQKEINKNEEAAKLMTYLQNQRNLVMKVEPFKPSDEQQLYLLKERIKEELMAQLQNQRAREQEEEKMYEKQRQKQIEELEEQLRKALLLQDEQLQKIQQQYRLKNQQLNQEYQLQILNKQIADQKDKEQQEIRLKEIQRKEDLKYLQMINKQIQSKDQTLKSHQSVPNEQNLSTIKQTPKIQIQPQIKEAKKENIVQQIQKSQVKEMSKQIIKETKKQPQYDSHQQIEADPIHKKNEDSLTKDINSSPTKLPIQSQKPIQTIKQNSDQVKQKYNNLLKLITKPAKQIYIPYDEIDSYLNKYYASLQKQAKEMLPYSRKQLQSLFKEMRVDIFEGNNFGFFKSKQNKFYLFGAIQCIPFIGSKYGEIQVESVYIFNKNNGYHKQYLAKRIKQYQKIGYIYQKKINQQGQYSIKMIVKIPNDGSKKAIVTKDQLDIRVTINFQNYQLSSQTTVKQNCIGYFLGQGLAKTLSPKQKAELSFSNNLYNKQMNENAINNDLMKTENETNASVSFSIRLPLKYFQTPQQSFYRIQADQYKILASSNSSKIYMMKLKDTGLAIFIYELEENEVNEIQNIESFMQPKLTNLARQIKISLFMPIWQNSSLYKYKGNSPRWCSFKQQIRASYIAGSIINNKVNKIDNIYVQSPFCFLVVETNQFQAFKRIIYGHIVAQQQISKALPFQKLK